MNVDQILQNLNELLLQQRLEEAEEYLLAEIEEAVRMDDMAATITLLNELVEFYRERGEREKCLAYCRQLFQIIQEAGLDGTIPYATSLLNIANSYCAAGLLRESMSLFERVRNIYNEQLEDGDYRYATLYNSMSLLFQEMGDYESACDCLKRALGIATQYSEARIEVAVTYTNLAVAQLKLMRYEEAIENLRRAFAIFELDDENDYHYSGALSAMGEAHYLA